MCMAALYETWTEAGPSVRGHDVCSVRTVEVHTQSLHTSLLLYVHDSSQ